MELNKGIINIGKGVLRALILTVILVLAISLSMSFLDLSEKTLSVLWMVTTCLSILLGATYAAKKNEKNGWLIGLILAVVYYLIIMIISSIFRGNFLFEVVDFGRLIIAMVIGILSGMLGINI
jgi:putative membrane protein (TIGR04086 family)